MVTYLNYRKLNKQVRNVHGILFILHFPCNFLFILYFPCNFFYFPKIPAGGGGGGGKFPPGGHP